MSIFQQPKIKVGDVVIGKRRLSFGTDGSNGAIRYFNNPSLILEIKDDMALVFFEQGAPAWYNLDMLERVYVKDEFENLDRRMAPIAFDHSDQSRNKNDNGDR
tara:strand:+ start:220 stop:528 length:309 start_codon:yes stop_codon:yes gene_type:complete